MKWVDPEDQAPKDVQDVLGEYATDALLHLLEQMMGPGVNLDSIVIIGHDNQSGELRVGGTMTPEMGLAAIQAVATNFPLVDKSLEEHVRQWAGLST